MKRRTHLRLMLGAISGLGASKAQSPQKRNAIQLFVEMKVDSKKEKEMLDNFHNIFLPEAKKHRGYIAVRLLKLRQVIQGPAQSINYRFELVYESEELRQQWIASPEHKRVWPTVEKTLVSQQDYPVLLFDEV